MSVHEREHSDARTALVFSRVCFVIALETPRTADPHELLIRSVLRSDITADVRVKPKTGPWRRRSASRCGHGDAADSYSQITGHEKKNQILLIGIQVTGSEFHGGQKGLVHSRGCPKASRSNWDSTSSPLTTADKPSDSFISELSVIQFH